MPSPGCISSILIKTENAVPINPAIIAKIKYIVPMSLWFVEYAHLFHPVGV
jgi:hypothetical protein